MDKTNLLPTDTRPETVTYFLTRILFLRSLAFVYFVAFLVAYNQNEGLLGDEGLLPAKGYFQRLKGVVGRNATKMEAFQKFPTLLWFLDYDGTDVLYFLQNFSVAGMTLSGLVFYHGCANSFVMGGYGYYTSPSTRLVNGGILSAGKPNFWKQASFQSFWCRRSRSAKLLKFPG